MKKIVWLNLKQLFKQFKNHNLSEYTAQCTYYMILAFIPFLILTVTLLQYTGISKDTFIWILETMIPTSMADSAIGIVQEVYSKSLGTISVSAIFLLWSARRGFVALSKGLHSAYDTSNNYIKLQLKSITATSILVLTVILVLVLSVFGNSIINFLQVKFNIPSSLINIFKITQIGIYGVWFIVLLLMYRFIPGHKIRIKYHVPGAIISTVGWYFCSLFFSIFIDRFKGFSVIYGSLTSITLAMMWVYFSMYIILIGAEVNSYIFKEKNKIIINKHRKCLNIQQKYDIMSKSKDFSNPHKIHNENGGKYYASVFVDSLFFRVGILHHTNDSNCLRIYSVLSHV